MKKKEIRQEKKLSLKKVQIMKISEMKTINIEQLFDSFDNIPIEYFCNYCWYFPTHEHRDDISIFF